jgi:hypothetical protein
MRRRVRGGLVATLIAAGLLALAAPSPGLATPRHPNHIPWPSVLPGRAVGPQAPARAVAGCPGLRLRCVNRLIRKMDGKWRRFDRRCDHRAVFALGYLRITREIRRRLRAGISFRFRPWFIGVVQGFSNLYYWTERRYDRARNVPEAWRIYYEAMDDGDYNAGQDLLLASNAHTNHDLPYAYAAMGLLTKRKGRTRKPDHDEVNDVNATIYRPLARYYAANYDPFFTLTNSVYPFDQLSMSQIVQGWRENAWRQAERLIEARGWQERQEVQQDIERTSAAHAEMITLGTEPGRRQIRDTHCASRAD